MRSVQLIHTLMVSCVPRQGYFPLQLVGLPCWFTRVGPEVTLASGMVGSRNSSDVLSLFTLCIDSALFPSLHWPHPLLPWVGPLPRTGKEACSLRSKLQGKTFSFRSKRMRSGRGVACARPQCIRRWWELRVAAEESAETRPTVESERGSEDEG